MNTLTTKVEALKIIARDALRMKLISPRLSVIAELEKNQENINKDIQNTEHRKKVEEYELSTLDKNHPDFENRKTSKGERIKNLVEAITELNKQKEYFNKQITDQKDRIAKIESGETKVNLEDLNEMVDKLVLQTAKNQISA